VTEDEGNERLLAQSAWLQALARSVVARHDLAHDVAQETLLVAWRRGTAGVHDLRGWLATILRRLAGKRVKAERQRAGREAALPPREPGLSPAELVAKAAMQREVVDAVLRLDEPYRAAVLQRYLDEKSPDAIAAASGVPLETVRTRLRRGLQQLRDDLDRRHGTARAWALPLLGIPGFEEALAASGATAAAGVAAAGAGVVTMSVQAKLGVGIAVVCVGLLAFGYWPSTAAGEVGPDSSPPTAVVVAANEPTVTAPPAAAPASPERTSVVAPAALVPSTPDAVIWRATGRVLDEATNLPVAGAQVVFTPNSRGHVRNAATENGVSGADGRFAFSFELLPGYAELAVRHEEYGAAHVPLLESVAKAAASGSRDAMLGDVMLSRGARLSGLVLASDGTTPMPGARVLHYRAAFGTTMQVFANTSDVARADATGRYELPWRAAPGYRREWLLAMTDVGIAWRELQPSRRESTNDRFDLVLRPTATLRLRILDAAGKPLAGATAAALPGCEPLSSPYDVARTQLATTPLPPFLRTTSDAEGVATLVLPIGDDGMQFGQRVPAGRAEVLVGCTGHRSSQKRLDLAVGEEREVAVRLVANVPLTVTGTVSSIAGSPIAGATVHLLGQRTTTDAAGAFRFTNVDAIAGSVAVQVLAAGHVAGGKEVACQDEATEVQIEVRLAPARTLRGIVVDQHGRPITTGFVSCGPGVNVQTGADGRFELTGVPLAHRSVVVAPGGTADEFALAVVPIPDPVPDELRIEVQRRSAGARVEIAVVDRVTGRSLEPRDGWLVPMTTDGRVQVSRPLHVRDGSCHDVDTPAGRYQVQVITRDGRRGRRELEVGVGVAVVKEQLPLDPAGLVRCTLDTSRLTQLPKTLTVTLSSMDAGGLRVPGRAVQADIGDIGVVLAPATEREIEVVGAIPDREFTLRVCEEGVVGEVAVTVAPGATAVVTLRLDEAGTLVFATRGPAKFDLLNVHWQLADGSWSTAQQLFACRGREELGAVHVPFGTVAWWVGYANDGEEPQRREGKTTVAPGVPARVVLP
jgi:RNA polymerase sigma factor (sigma-70 family)